MSHGQWWWVVECSGGDHRKTIGDVLQGLGLCSYQNFAWLLNISLRRLKMLSLLWIIFSTRWSRVEKTWQKYFAMQFHIFCGLQVLQKNGCTQYEILSGLLSICLWALKDEDFFAQISFSKKKKGVNVRKWVNIRKANFLWPLRKVPKLWSCSSKHLCGCASTTPTQDCIQAC